MHYGVPPHSLAAVREFFNGVFLQQWIGREGLTALTARPPPHIKHLDFYFWGYLQSIVCATEVSDVQNM